MSEKTFGMFDHVPTPEEAAARAFSMSRDEQWRWSWPAYACGLIDAGVNHLRAIDIMLSATGGEFSHNIEEAFRDEPDPIADEIDRLKDENAALRELVRAAWGCVKGHVPCDECRVVAAGCTLKSAMKAAGIEVGE